MPELMADNVTIERKILKSRAVTVTNLNEWAGSTIIWCVLCVINFTSGKNHMVLNGQRLRSHPGIAVGFGEITMPIDMGE